MTDAPKPSRKRKPKGPFSDELIDQLLSQSRGKDAQSLLGESGVVGQLKQQLAERMLAAELSHHLESEAADGDEGAGSGNHRNGTTPKTVITPEGALPLDIPRDRLSTFEPRLVAKYQRRLPGFDERVIGMYARGMTVREIQGHLLEIYGLEVSPQLISTVTDEVLAEVAQWQAQKFRYGHGWSRPNGHIDYLRSPSTKSTAPASRSLFATPPYFRNSASFSAVQPLLLLAFTFAPPARSASTTSDLP